MHIAFYTNTYHPVVSGVVQSIYAFRQALIDKGHNVFVFAQEAKDYEDTEPFIFRYPAISLPMEQNYPLTIPISNHVDWLLPALKLDVIHSHRQKLLALTSKLCIILMTSRLCKIPQNVGITLQFSTADLPVLSE